MARLAWGLPWGGMRLPLALVAAAGLVLVAVVFVLGVGEGEHSEGRLKRSVEAPLFLAPVGVGGMALGGEVPGGTVAARQVVSRPLQGGPIATVLPPPGRPVMIGQVTDESLEPVADVQVHCEFRAGSQVLDLGTLSSCKLGYFFCDLSPLQGIDLQVVARGRIVAEGALEGWIFSTTEAGLLDIFEDVQDPEVGDEPRLDLATLGELRWMASAYSQALDADSLDCDMYMDAQPGRTVRGKVVDEAGTAVPGAVVWLSTELLRTAVEFHTDQAGTFEFGLWGEHEQDWGDSIRVHAMHPSHGQSVAARIEPDGGDLELRLKRAGALMGYVTSVDGADTSGMEVWLESEQDGQGLPGGYCATRVAFDGSFVFRGLEPGRWFLYVGDEEYGPFETGNHRIQLQTGRKLLRVNLTAQSHVDLSLVTLSAWSLGAEGRYPAPLRGVAYGDEDFVCIGPGQWLLELEEQSDLGISATVDWGDSFATKDCSWHGEASWLVGQDLTLGIQLEQRGLGSLEVEVELPGGAPVNPSQWTAKVWSASHGEPLLWMDPGQVEPIPTGTYTVKLVPDTGLPFNVQFMTVAVAPGEKRVLHYEPSSVGARLSIRPHAPDGSPDLRDIHAKLYHGEDLTPTATLWSWSSGCVGSTTPYLLPKSWNKSQTMLEPGAWRANLFHRGELVQELEFEIVDGQDLSLSVPIGN